MAGLLLDFINRLRMNLFESIGKARWELPGAVPLNSTWEQHRALLEARQPFRDFEYMRAIGDGGARYLIVSGEPVFDRGGRFTGYRGTARDVTDRRRAEDVQTALYETPAMARARPPRGSHAPGTFWYYNNWDFNVLGTIYERATGTGIYDALDRLIAKPIGMQDYRPSDGTWNILTSSSNFTASIVKKFGNSTDRPLSH